MMLLRLSNKLMYPKNRDDNEILEDHVASRKARGEEALSLFWSESQQFDHMSVSFISVGCFICSTDGLGG